MMTLLKRLFPIAMLLTCISNTSIAVDLPRISVAANRSGFNLEHQDKHFSPWGFNYDHDQKGRLIEDYWETEWEKVERDFRSMKQLGANVVRIHLQLGKFMQSATEPNKKGLEQLGKLVTLAEEVGVYLDLTGLGCYHKAEYRTGMTRLTNEVAGTRRQGSGSRSRQRAIKVLQFSVTT